MNSWVLWWVGTGYSLNPEQETGKAMRNSIGKKWSWAVVFLGLGAMVPLHGAGTGSLWNHRGVGGSMYTDKVAANVGDIVTIVVQEQSQISASKSSSTEKSSAVADQLRQIVEAVTVDGVTPGMDWESSKGFEGGGEIANSQSAQSQLSVMVVDRLPNGNLVIEGMRKVTMANEINYAVLRGYIRPTDIRSDNSILSSRVADAQIEFVAEGALTEAQRQGWLNRVYSFLNPF